MADLGQLRQIVMLIFLDSFPSDIFPDMNHNLFSNHVKLCHSLYIVTELSQQKKILNIAAYPFIEAFT